MALPFDMLDIQASLGNATLLKGFSYLHQQRVQALRWDPESQVLLSRVQGRRKQPYEQYVAIDSGYGGFIEGECSCPMGGDCKHVAAALLGLLDGLASASPGSQAVVDPLQAWQRSVSDFIDAGAAAEAAAGTTAIIYKLRIQDYPGHRQARVEIYQSRRLKRGGYGKAQRLDLYRLNGLAYRGDGLSPDDAKIASLLRTFETYDELVLSGDLGGLLLQALMQSGRCFLDGDDLTEPPLCRGPQRDLQLSWRADEAGNQHLLMALESTDDRWVCLPVEPAYYLDPASRAVGRLAHPLPAGLLNRLQCLPPVPAEKQLDFSYFLADRVLANPHLLASQEPSAGGLPGAARAGSPVSESACAADDAAAEPLLPLPVALTICPITAPPKPLLTLCMIKTLWGSRRGARLEVSYGEQRMPWEATPTETRIVRYQGDRMLVLERDPAQELPFAERLGAAGLLAASQIERTEAGVFLPPRINSSDLDAQEAAEINFWAGFAPVQTALADEGWQISVDPAFDFELVQPDQWHLGIQESGADGASAMDWFELALEVEVGGETVPLLPLLTRWLATASAHEFDGERPLMVRHGKRWLQLDGALLRPILSTLVELHDRPELDDAGQLHLNRSQLARVAALGETTTWQLGGSARLRELAEQLHRFEGIAPCAPPAGLQAELRDYQQRGVDWLQFLAAYGFGGILADDMGLGKTLQTLAHLQAEKEQGRLTQPAMVVAPTSVLHNWQREAARFTPQLRVAVLHGSERHALLDDVSGLDLLITSYALLIRDQQRLRGRVSWLILDEAQAIKNPLAKGAIAARELAAPRRLCLTGTPLENHLGELWSLFHFLMPGFLADQNRFNRLFRHPIEKQGERARQQELSARVAPFLLRRTKEAVASELPPKTEMVRNVILSGDQRKLYETIRVSMEKRVQTLLQEKGLVRSRIEVLDALLKLRQVCCDPRLVKLPAAAKVKGSAKLELLAELLPDLIEEGRRILLFSQFTSMLDLIGQELDRLKLPFIKLTGRTRNRQALVDRFQAGEVPLFLISLKAGGTGLNLTAADTVIHYDPWWNPAVERQATDRAYRIGQDKPVFVYRLVTEQTVEEKILALQAGKQALADGLYAEGEQEAGALGADDLLALFRPF